MKIYRISVLWLFLAGSVLGAKLTMEEMVGGLEKSVAEWGKKYESARPAGGAALEGESRLPALSYLRYLMEVEDILRRLREDAKEREGQMATEALSASDKKRLLGMRHDALMERVENIIDPPRRGPNSRAQEKLYKGLVSKSKRAITDRDKAQKALDRLLEGSRVDEEKVKKVEAELEKARNTITALETAFYGPAPLDGGFEEVFDGRFPGKAEELLDKVVLARDGVLADLRKTADIPENLQPGEGKKKAVIAGVTVNSVNLGVLLDNSSSMTPYLDPLRKEIGKSYPHAHFRECYGCALQWSVGAMTKDKRDRVMLWMEDLIIVEKVDGLYWFSDLNDPVTDEALRRLSWLRSRGKTSLYVLSVGKKPTRELMEQVDSYAKHKVK